MSTTALNGSMRRVAAASFVGTAIEWYDFLLYGTMSAIVFGRLFFPALDPAIGTIASLSLCQPGQALAIMRV